MSRALFIVIDGRFYLYGRLSLCKSICKSILKKTRFGSLQTSIRRHRGIGAPKWGIRSRTPLHLVRSLSERRTRSPGRSLAPAGSRLESDPPRPNLLSGGWVATHTPLRQEA